MLFDEPFLEVPVVMLSGNMTCSKAAFIGRNQDKIFVGKRSSMDGGSSPVEPFHVRFALHIKPSSSCR
jgi:hypothetical protein